MVMATVSVLALTTVPFASASATVRCSADENEMRLVDRTRKKLLFTTTLHVRWCYDGQRVRDLGRISLEPRLTDWGSASGYEYGGDVPEARRESVINFERMPRAGYRVDRTVKWKWCSPFSGITGCKEYLFHMSSFLYWDDHADHWNRRG